MFTGIVTQIGKLIKVDPLNDGLEVTISCDTRLLNCQRGDSISVSGVCSTVVDYNENSFVVQYLEETLNKTTFNAIKKGDYVNLEPSLTLQTKLSGHFVSGHVDGVGKILDIKLNDPWSMLKISYEEKLASYFIYKGSICLDGISLTVAEVNTHYFICYIIPHTFKETILKYKNIGDSINLECDFIGKYVLRQLDLGKNLVNDK
tara:strand:- start:832 stop:1443 length:612 start_codon:yes stop_codon:yes gene_type:complete